MEIRSTKKDYNKIIKLNKNNITVTLDETLKMSVIMVHTDDGKFVQWTSGFENISSFLKYGYVRIRRSCPYRHRRCIGEKCSLYVIQNNTGDCAHIWNIYIHQ